MPCGLAATLTHQRYDQRLRVIPDGRSEVDLTIEDAQRSDDLLESGTKKNEAFGITIASTPLHP
jgi:hypothetical protein